ncbi:MAG: class I SAM-dependent methyltransferase [Syntrophales bacterium]|nr:class I SAM-dependent methyltransferase [Syntrophales bacterium]
MIYLLIVLTAIISVLLIIKILLVVSTVIVLPITRGAMFHPTALNRLRIALERVPMKEGELFIDLGCGDGRALVAAVQRYGTYALGYEINPFTYVLAKIRTMGKKKIKISYRNFWHENLKKADIIFCYLFPDVMDKLAEKLTRELRPGTRVISCNFPLPGWKAEQVIDDHPSCHGDPIYVYQVGISSHDQVD